MKIAEIVFGFGMMVSIILCSGLAMVFNSATHYGRFAPVQFASAGEVLSPQSQQIYSWEPCRTTMLNGTDLNSDKETPTWSVISTITVINGSTKSAVRLGGDSNVSAGINVEANNSTLSMTVNTGDSASISGDVNASGNYIYAESYAENQNNSARINVSVAESNLLNMTMNTEASSEKTGAVGNVSAEGNNIWLGAYSNDTERYRSFFKGQVKGLLYADEYSGFFIPFKPHPAQIKKGIK